MSQSLTLNYLDISLSLWMLSMSRLSLSLSAIAQLSQADVIASAITFPPSLQRPHVAPYLCLSLIFFLVAVVDAIVNGTAYADQPANKLVFDSVRCWGRQR